jgi:DNA-directed RNA polymerase specialized sigma24 family protein
LTYKALCGKIDELHASGDSEQLWHFVRLLAYRRLYDDDAAQTVVIKAWQRRKQYKPTAPFHAWVNKIINTVRVDAIRSASSAPRSIPFVDAAIHDERTPSVTFPCAESKRVFWARAEGYSEREIATELGITSNALKQRMKRWRKKIQVSFAA